MSNNIRKEEKEIFEQWERILTEPDKIIVDGVIDIETWEHLEEGKHILFVLRDKNGGTKAKYKNDFRQELAECGSGWKTWNNAARWGQALLNPEQKYEDVKYLSSGVRGQMLRSFAVMNLLKAYGGNYTNRERLDRITEQEDYCDLLRRQLLLYNPDIVIACGMKSNKHKSNMEILAEIFSIKEENYKWIRIGNRIYRYIVIKTVEKNVPIIEFYHPQATYASCFDGQRGHELWKQMFEDMKELAVIKANKRSTKDGT